MKFLIIALALCSIIACKKEAASTITLNERIDTTATIVVLKDSGSFISGPFGSTMGYAKIYQTGNTYQLALENFSVSNGPDLKVYLSKEIQPINFIKLASLKSTNGYQLYNIPSSIVIKDYPYALIHCEQYNHLFGYAQLR